MTSSSQNMFLFIFLFLSLFLAINSKDLTQLPSFFSPPGSGISYDKVQIDFHLLSFESVLRLSKVIVLWSSSLTRYHCRSPSIGTHQLEGSHQVSSVCLHIALVTKGRWKFCPPLSKYVMWRDLSSTPVCFQTSTVWLVLKKYILLAPYYFFILI